MDEAYREVKISIPESMLNKIVSTFPGKRNKNGTQNATPAHEAIARAIESYVDNLNTVRISEETLREIASESGVERIQSEKDLIGAIRRATKLGPDKCVLEIDPNLMPMVYQAADANGCTVGEQLREYVQHAIHMGWYGELWLDVFYVSFTKQQMERLAHEFGVPKIKDGTHLYQLVMREFSKERILAIADARQAESQAVSLEGVL